MVESASSVSAATESPDRSFHHEFRLRRRRRRRQWLSRAQMGLTAGGRRRYKSCPVAHSIKDRASRPRP